MKILSQGEENNNSGENREENHISTERGEDMTDEEKKKYKEREKLKAVLAHEIAKQVAAATVTYAEAFEVLELVEKQLTDAMRYKHKPTTLDYPVDRYNQKIEKA